MYKRRISSFLLVALLLLSTAALSGCISEEEEETPAPTTAAPTTAAPTTAAPTTAAPEYPDEIKIGCLCPLTGPIPSTGEAQKMSIEFAAWLVNNEVNSPILMCRSEGLDNLGGAKVVPIFGDGGCSAEVAQQEAERIVSQNDDLVALYGELCSSATQTAANVAKKYGIPMVNGSSSSPKLTAIGLEWFFRVSPHDGLFIKTMFEFMKDMNAEKNAGIEEIALAYEDTEFGTTSAGVFKQYAAEYGFDIIEDISYSKNTTDVDSEVQRLKAADPDVILMATYAADTILFFKTFEKYDVNIPVIGNGSGFTKAEFLEISESQYALSRATFTPDMFEQMPSAQAIDQMFEDRYGISMADWTRDVMAFLVLCDAINRAGSTDPDEIRQALLETDIPKSKLVVPWDGIAFDPDTHQNIYSSGIVCQALGEPTLMWSVWPFEFAGKELVWPPTPWDER
jgi:branched-chain amino acid transport system substrate-binding protein